MVVVSVVVVAAGRADGDSETKAEMPPGGRETLADRELAAAAATAAAFAALPDCVTIVEWQYGHVIERALEWKVRRFEQTGQQADRL